MNENEDDFEIRLVGGSLNGQIKKNPTLMDEDQPVPYFFNSISGEVYAKTDKKDDDERVIFEYDPGMKGPWD
jgi:hypothetical protein